MSDLRCERVRERLPELAAGRLDGAEARRLEEHLEGCTSCAEERELLGLLVRGRPPVPAGLAERIKAGLAEGAAGAAPPRAASRRRRGPPFPWWGLAAAAVAAVALGIGIRAPGPSSPAGGQDGAPFAMEVEEDDLWLSGDGEIAGAPTLDDLTDEALLRFLEELETGGVA